jgi:hypothetical protein
MTTIIYEPYEATRALSRQAGAAVEIGDGILSMEVVDEDAAIVVCDLQRKGYRVVSYARGVDLAYCEAQAKAGNPELLAAYRAGLVAGGGR